MEAGYWRDDEANVEMVTLGTADGGYLMVQRALEFDDQDVRLGMDTYCLVTSSHRTMYGGVAGCTVDDRRVHLTFTAEAVEALGVSPHLTVVIDGADHREVTDALRRLLG